MKTEDDRLLDEVKSVVQGRSVLLGLSGGADSCVLLHLLLRAEVPVICVHVEHGIRGAASERDCAFAEELCNAWKVPLFVEHADVPAYAKEQGLGLEDAARRLRYAAFKKVQREQGADVLVTAHHAGDQAETILLHLLRGTGLSGLSGMKREENGLLRPLLPFSKAQLLAYASAHGIAYVTDETNADTRYTRNYIRHVLLPAMEQVNPCVEDALCRLGGIAGQQNDYLVLCAGEVLKSRMSGSHLSELSDLHPGLAGVAAVEYLRALGFSRDVSQREVSRLLALFNLPCGKRAPIGKQMFERDATGIAPVTEPVCGREIPLHFGCNDTPFGCITITEGGQQEPLNQGKNVQLLDAERLGSLTVRSRRDGDKVRPLGAPGEKLLSDLFTDRKVPQSKRDFVPLIVSGGSIVWVCGVAALEPAKITENTVKIIKITLKG